MDYKDRLYEQYKLAINSRDKLTDNYHKWMTFYYVAGSAILIAITTLYNKDSENQGLLFLSLLGLFICILWNLSCKGYYHFVSDGLQKLCDLSNIYPCVLDAAVFSSYDNGEWTADNTVF